MTAWANSKWEAYGYESTSTTLDTSITMPPGTYGAAPQAVQRSTFLEAFGWMDGFARIAAFAEPKQFDRFGDWYGTHLLTDTTDASRDYWDWASAQRRVDLPKRQVAYRAQTRLADVVAMWVPDPTPGRVAYGLTIDHYYVRYAEDGVIEIRIWNRLGAAPPLIGLPGNDRYYMEVCVKGLLEAWVLLAEENWPGTIAELTGAFGARGSWDSGQLEAQVKFTVVEHLKDMLFSGRVTNGRPIRKLTRERYRTLCDKVISRARWPKGPMDQKIGGTQGNLVSGYTAPVAGMPFPPRPRWSPLGRGDGFQGAEDYDHPVPMSIPNPGVVTSWQGLGWQWGGRRGGASGSSSVLKPPNLDTYDRDTPPRPPKPGTVVHFRVEWSDPVAPVPNTPQHLMTDPVTRQVLDPGQYVFEMGDPLGVDGSGGAAAIASSFGRGVVWCMGDRPDLPYPFFELPDGLYVGRATYRDPPPGLEKTHYFPMYFDFSKAGSWDFALTVPDHGGELGLKFSWLPAWGDAVAGIIGAYPIQTVPEQPLSGAQGINVMFTQFPRAKLQPPPVLPEGQVQTQPGPPGQYAIGEGVHGDDSLPVVLFDPVSNGISTVRHG